MARNTMARSIQETLGAALAEDPTVVLLGETTGRAGGAGGSTTGLRERWEDRVWDTPIADRGTLGMALGLSLGGRRPVVELSGPGRLLAVAEVLAEAAEIATGTEFPLPLVLRVPYGAQAGQRLDRAVGRALAEIDGLGVACATAATAATLLRSALRATGPVVLLEPRAAYRRRVQLYEQPLRLDRARLLRRGRHLTLAAWGEGVHAASAAAQQLSEEGIEADVLDLISLRPVDAETLGARVRHTGRLLTVSGQDPSLGAAVAQAALEQAFLYLESPLAHTAGSPAAIARTARAAITY